jgi:tetratricopeptide (TPR) repeat protein
MLNPGCSYAYGNYAWFLISMRRFEESIANANKARDLNPLSLPEKTMYGERLFEAGRYDEAVEQLIKALDSDPDFAYAQWILGFVYEQKNMYDEAINHHQKAVECSGEMATCVASLGHAYAISGKTNEANRVLNQLIELSKNQYISSYDIAIIYVGLGEFDNAIEWLEKAFAQRDGYLGGWINVDPRLNILRTDKRFVGLLKRIGFKNDL